jgi:uncharacterized membrane protein YdjX (TVP38/TMEM64 family)
LRRDGGGAEPQPCSRPYTRAAVAFLLFGGVGLVFALGAGVLGASGPATAARWLAEARGPWALPAAAALFAGLAFLGVPQFVLIAAAVAAFGPTAGAAYSWVGTMVSALIGYGVGRVAGGRILALAPGDMLTRFTDLTRRHGLIASLVVRLTPFAPFVLVNVAAGTAGVGVASFVVGTGIGIVPKIALTAFVGASIMRGSLVPIVLLLIAAALWFGASFAARRWMKR